MIVLFLDIDGVLNQDCYSERLNETLEMSSYEWWAEMVDPTRVALLNELLDETNAVVVVSSTWRFCLTADELQHVLETRGFTGSIIGVTPPTEGDRVAAIKQWLERHDETIHFVALDDQIDPSELDGRAVKTDPTVGLHDLDVGQAVWLLRRSMRGM